MENAITIFFYPTTDRLLFMCKYFHEMDTILSQKRNVNFTQAARLNIEKDKLKLEERMLEMRKFEIQMNTAVAKSNQKNALNGMSSN